MTIARRALAALCLVVGSAMPAHAQNGGVEIGALASYVTAAKGTPRQMQTVPTGGFFIEAPFISTMRWHVGIHYAQRRSRLAFGSDTEMTDIRIDYLSTPILIRMPMFWGLYVTEGASFHFPIRGTFTRPGGPARDVLTNLTAPDISMVIGLGVRFGRVGLEGRWDSGFLTVQETQDPSEFPGRNRAISALFVYGL
jgi:hypothetical protein